MKKPGYNICSRCVLDTTTELINFDAKGVCNFCHDYDTVAETTVDRPLEDRTNELQNYVDTIKKHGKNQKYDCIVGISGGMDSSYLTHLVVNLGLRPYVVHFDNGWNTELAVKNINNIITKLNVDLYTYVIDWEEFKDLQIAYFKSGVIDIEVPTDQLIFAILFKLAKKFKIKYFFDGYNFRTEQGMPLDWTFLHKFDLTNLKNIHSKFGKLKLKNFPTLSSTDLYEYQEIWHIKQVSILHLIDFNPDEVIELLGREYDYVTYQYKHYESVFTRFYQGYILPQKWGIDKRKAHLSTKIRSRFISRDFALSELTKPTYPIEQQQEDKLYVLKKWDMTEQEFDTVMASNPVPHEAYGLDKVSPWSKLKVKFYLIYLYKFAYPLGLRKKLS